MNQLDVKQVIVMRTRYPNEKGGTRKIRTGKLIAQACHASHAALEAAVEAEMLLPPRSVNPCHVWINSGSKKVVVYVDTEQELIELVELARQKAIPCGLVKDQGLTEFNEQTVTALGIGPWQSERIDEITGELPLL